MVKKYAEEKILVDNTQMQITAPENKHNDSINNSMHYMNLKNVESDDSIIELS